MTDLVVETANPHHLASLEQGVSQAQAANQALVFSEDPAVTAVQAQDSEQAAMSNTLKASMQTVSLDVSSKTSGATDSTTRGATDSETAAKAESIWYLYLIRCANGHLYTGITTDVTRRFNEHQSNSPKAAKYLRGKGPLTLMYQEQVVTRSDALKREIAVKKFSRAQKLALIESGRETA